ncbi:hypothetical protein PR048_021623 [Dryococelus australis]|uniref:Uncharacterized protein n=1 Tax=Dryococelus australis TaxID=614101 RepID=A0ABQ9GYQ1_9NEOP|nr:hypothetical protein PR048_021623 [Dryococelus australis]
MRSRRVRAASQQKRWWEAIEPGYSGITDEDLPPKQASKYKDMFNFIDVEESQWTREAWYTMHTISIDLDPLHVVTTLEEMVTSKKLTSQ